MKFSTRLREVLKEKGINQTELSKMTGISKSVISEWLSDKYEPKQDKVYIVAEKLSVSPSWLFGVSSEKEVKSDVMSIYNQLTPQRQTKVYNFAEAQLHEQNNKVVPLVGATAANPTALEYADAINDISINTDVPNNADCALVVRGNSMETDYMDGSIVFYKRQDMVENGELAIVEIDGDGVTFKKIIFDYDNQQVILRSLNSDYEDRVLKEDEYRIIGKVVK